MSGPHIGLQIVINAQWKIGRGNSSLLEQRSCVTPFLVGSTCIVGIGVNVNPDRNAKTHALLYIV